MMMIMGRVRMMMIRRVTLMMMMGIQMRDLG